MDSVAWEVRAFEVERLPKSCARLIWLNPLLRYTGFAAQPAGIRAILPHDDDVLPVHNVAAPQDLAGALNHRAHGKPSRGWYAGREWRAVRDYSIDLSLPAYSIGR